jgi:hypothetical protein
MSFTSLFTSFAWYCLQSYSYIEMWYNYYFPESRGGRNETMELPFNIIEKNGLYQIYYPRIEQTSYKFLQVQVEIQGQKYEIESNPFMVVGNRLFDRPFIDWILGTDPGMVLDDDEEYSVLIMDHEVNIITLTPKEYIELNKDNYLKKCLDE